MTALKREIPIPDNNSDARKLLASLASDSKYYDWVQNALHYSNEDHLNEEHLWLIVNFLLWRQEQDRMPIYDFTKKCFDMAVASLILLAISPLFLLIALAIKIESRGPVFFRQLRTGKNYKLLWILKFRTMRVGAYRKYSFVVEKNAAPMAKIPQDPRITKVGKFLRRWKLDELPQVVNVLRGEMSLVGPRPLTIDDTATIESFYFQRFAVTPGMTGWWQAKIPVVTDGRMKIILDCEYVRVRGWRTDLKIIWNTIAVLRRGEF